MIINIKLLKLFMNSLEIKPFKEAFEDPTVLLNSIRIFLLNLIALISFSG